MKYVDKANGMFTAVKKKEDKDLLLQETGCKGPYSLRRLPHHDRYLNTPVEPMHVIKNIGEHLVNLISGKTDSTKLRLEEQTRGRFSATWCDLNTGKRKLPPAPFCLSKSELVIANQRSVNIVVPLGVDWKSRSLFSRGVSLKSSEWKNVLSQGILKFCIRGLLGENQRNTLFELCDCVTCLTAEEVDTKTIDALEYRVHRVLTLLERDFPISIHVIMFHLLHHLPMFIDQFSAFGCILSRDTIPGSAGEH